MKSEIVNVFRKIRWQSNATQRIYMSRYLVVYRSSCIVVYLSSRRTKQSMNRRIAYYDLYNGAFKIFIALPYSNIRSMKFDKLMSSVTKGHQPIFLLFRIFYGTN